MRPVILYRDIGEWEEEEKSAFNHFPLFQRRSDIPSNSLVIGRYSVLPFYKELEDELIWNDSKLINTYRQHRYVADLSIWYEDLKEYTPKTWFRLEDLPDDGPFFLKGETNSKKFFWNTHCFAKNKKEAIEIEGRLFEDSLIHNQKICIRQFIPLKTFMIGLRGLPITNEYRFFCYKKEILSGGYYWASHTDEVRSLGVDLNPAQVPMDFLNTIANIAGDRVNFWVMDVAQKENGDWILIELNDGQMSGLSENNPWFMYRLLKEFLDTEQEQ